MNRISFRAAFLGVAVLMFAVGATAALADLDGLNALYFENNDDASGQNAVVAYIRHPSDGSLTFLGTFPTGGTGYKNVDQRLGPDDTDQEVIISPDKRFLFAVNAGSDDISVFRILPDRTLALVPGSPFPSNGKQPGSLTIVGNRLYVANRGDGILATGVAGAVAGTLNATNYTGFTINPDGSLTPIAGSTILLADGSSPSQILSALSGTFLIGNNFFVPDGSVTPPAAIFPKARSFLDPLAINSANGQLTLWTPQRLPMAYDPAPYMLGMHTHPSQNILYTGLVGFGRVGVWQYDSLGNLSFYGQESDPSSVGAAGGLCWITVDPGAHFLYTSSVVPDVIGVLSLTNPLVPTRIQNFVPGGSKSSLPAAPEPYMFTTAPFNLVVDPTSSFLYVLNNQTCTSLGVDPDCVNGTALHILRIAADGTLSDTASSPVYLSSLVPYHAHGLALLDVAPAEAPAASLWGVAGLAAALCLLGAFVIRRSRIPGARAV